MRISWIMLIPSYFESLMCTCLLTHSAGYSELTFDGCSYGTRLIVSAAEDVPIYAQALETTLVTPWVRRLHYTKWCRLVFGASSHALSQLPWATTWRRASNKSMLPQIAATRWQR